jgi:translation initiation factor IF-3
LKRGTYKRAEEERRYRINYQIPASTLRLLDETGKQVGILSKLEALQKAKSLELDIVEIAPNASPPVAKLIDYKKFKYQEAKKRREEKKGVKSGGIKEVRLRPFTGEHDLQVAASKGNNFLNDSNQLKVNIFFKGREIVRKEFGFTALQSFLKRLAPVKIVREPHLEGKKLVATVVRDKGSKESDQEQTTNGVVPQKVKQIVENVKKPTKPVQHSK